MKFLHTVHRITVSVLATWVCNVYLPFALNSVGPTSCIGEETYHSYHLEVIPAAHYCLCTLGKLLPVHTCIVISIIIQEELLLIHVHAISSLQSTSAYLPIHGWISLDPLINIYCKTGNECYPVTEFVL